MTQIWFSMMILDDDVVLSPNGFIERLGLSVKRDKLYQFLRFGGKHAFVFHPQRVVVYICVILK